MVKIWVPNEFQTNRQNFKFCQFFSPGYHGDKIWHFQNILESVQYGSHLFGTDVRSNPVKF